jgi:hypothetical protein
LIGTVTANHDGSVKRPCPDEGGDKENKQVFGLFIAQLSFQADWLAFGTNHAHNAPKIPVEMETS